VSAPADGVSVDDLLESASRNLTAKQARPGRNPQGPPPESIH